jgi:hypothetical protein
VAATSVLILGWDPRTVPGYDPAPVLAAIERGTRRFEERGVSYQLGLVPFDDSAADRIVELLRRELYECVLIGGGIRKEEELLGFFEIVVNLVRRHAPEAAIAFDSTPDDLLDAALRWITTG